MYQWLVLFIISDLKLGDIKNWKSLDLLQNCMHKYANHHIIQYVFSNFSQKIPSYTYIFYIFVDSR